MRDWKRTAALVAVAMAIPASIFTVIYINLPQNGDLEKYETVTKILAFLAVAAFALYKLFSGFHLSNMSVAVSSVRVPAEDGKDNLAITVSLAKGDRGTIRLEDAKARVSYGDTHQPIALDGVERLNTGKLRNGKWETSARRPYLYLTPGEKMVVASHTKVPSDVSCLIEVIFAGKTLVYWRSGQWRASCVSLPLKKR